MQNSLRQPKGGGRSHSRPLSDGERATRAELLIFVNDLSVDQGQIHLKAFERIDFTAQRIAVDNDQISPFTGFYGPDFPFHLERPSAVDSKAADGFFARDLLFRTDHLAGQSGPAGDTLPQGEKRFVRSDQSSPPPERPRRQLPGKWPESPKR